MSNDARPSAPRDEAELVERLTAPTEETLAAVRQLAGNVVVLGAGGKIGPSLALLIRRSLAVAGSPHRVTCVSRFSDAGTAMMLGRAGIRTIAADLMDRKELERLPDAPHIYYLAGMKFGTSADPAQTWALNTLMTALVAERYAHSEFVALSTGNVYPFVDVRSGGATEDTPPAPIGDYAQSCLGRERMIQYSASRYGGRAVIVRLNYATDLRYGVLVDVARSVAAGEPVDVRMGYLNTIWQADACSVIFRSRELCANPPAILNLTGPDTIAVRSAATTMADIMGVPAPEYVGIEAETALLSNASACWRRFGPPHVPTDVLLEWTALWVRSGGALIDKPTHFQVRDGRF